MTATDVRPDDPTLRLERRRRVLAEMEAEDVDVLVVGREANARYIAGAPRLWLAGTRPFGPGCVLVRETGDVYLLTTWDEGVPEDIPHEHLYGITFNSANLFEVLRGIEGAATARTVATDAMNGGSSKLLAGAFPEATVVDGEPLLQRARRIKTAEEIDAIRAAVGVAESSLDAAVGALRAGVTERELTGVFMHAMATAGVTTPSTQDIAWITSRDQPWHRAATAAPVADGDLVAFEAGVLMNGYLGEIGRTRVVGDAPGAAALFARRDDVWERLLGACVVDAPVSDLLDVYDDVGVDRPPMPVARGLGMGFDLPIAAAQLPRTAAAERLEEGMVLALTAYVWEEGIGGCYGQEPVVVTSDGPELLSTTPFHGRRDG